MLGEIADLLHPQDAEDTVGKAVLPATPTGPFSCALVESQIEEVQQQFAKDSLMELDELQPQQLHKDLEDLQRLQLRQPENRLREIIDTMCRWCLDAKNKLANNSFVCKSCLKYAQRIFKQKFFPKVARVLCQTALQVGFAAVVGEVQPDRYVVSRAGDVLQWLCHPENRNQIADELPTLKTGRKMAAIWPILVEYHLAGKRKRTAMRKDGSHSFQLPQPPSIAPFNLADLPLCEQVSLDDIFADVCNLQLDLSFLDPLYVEQPHEVDAKAATKMNLLGGAIGMRGNNLNVPGDLEDDSVELVVLHCWLNTDKKVDLLELQCVEDGLNKLKALLTRVSVLINSTRGCQDGKPHEKFEINFNSLANGLQIYAKTTLEGKERKDAIASLHTAIGDYGILAQYFSQFFKIKGLKADENVFCQLLIEEGDNVDDAIESFEAVFMDLLSTYMTKTYKKPVTITDKDVQLNCFKHRNTANVQISAAPDSCGVLQQSLDAMLQQGGGAFAKLMAMHGVFVWPLTRFKVMPMLS